MRKHIVLVWELGAGYGHITGMKPIIQSLLEKNYKISLLSHNLATAHHFLSEYDIDIYQAPIWSSKSSYLKNTLSFAEILISLGYCSNNLLNTMVKAWLNLLNHLQPDLVIADHSPTAILASRLLQLKISTIGIGFFIPPKSNPVPAFSVLNQNQDKQVLQSEQRVLTAINSLLKTHQQAPFKQFSDLFYPATHFLCTFKELDHFHNRSDVNYVGALFDSESGVQPQWPKKYPKKIFAYIKEGSKGFNETINALSAIKKVAVVMHIPQAKKDTMDRFKGLSHIKIHTQPVIMKNIYEEADLVICHAGHAVVAASLLQGKRLLIIPTQLEQMVLSSRLSQQHLAMAINPNNNRLNYVQTIDVALNHPEFGKAALQFMKQYKTFGQSQQLLALTEQIERLIKT